MFNMSFTETIALLGCVTGFISLAISLRQVWLERFTLKIKFFENENMYFSKLECCKDLRTKLQGVVRMRLVNCSSNPITIYSIKLFIDGTGVTTRNFDGDSFTITTYLYPDGRSEFIEVPMKKQLLLPLRINAYDVVEGFIFIPFYPDTEKICQSLKCRIETTKGCRTAYSNIWIRRMLIDDGNGPFFQ